MSLRRFSCRVILFTLIVSFFASCGDDSSEQVIESHQLIANKDSEIIYDWYEMYLDVEKDLVDFRPNPTSRALGYIGIAAYEACLPGMTEYLSIDNYLSDYVTPSPNPYNEFYWSTVIENEYYWDIVLNQTYYRMFDHLLFNVSEDHRNSIDALYNSNIEELSSKISQIGFNSAMNRANIVSDAVIAYARSDREGADQVREIEPVDYHPPSGVGFWQPTSPDFRNACHPYWNRVRTFITPSGGVQLQDHALYSEEEGSEFYSQALEVYNTTSNLEYDDRWIAEFWSDDIVGVTFSPPARQIAIANQLIELDQSNMEKTLRLYLRLGMGLNDASVVCWGAKYEYNLERPVDYIRRLIDPNFNPILGDAVGVTGQNPNFPAYPSGHATFGGIGASVFNMFFPSISEFTDRCHEDETLFIGDPRSFDSFDQMAKENSDSRIPLGVHFRMDCDEGLRIGNNVGDFITGFSLER